jgi:hypothetical protein
MQAYCTPVETTDYQRRRCMEEGDGSGLEDSSTL